MTTVCANKKRPRAKKSRSRTPTLIHTPIKTTDKDFGGSTRFRGTLHARSERDSEIAIQLGACVQFSLIGTARKKFNTFLIQSGSLQVSIIIYDDILSLIISYTMRG